jgi:predicted component of type VI protein secretion system
MQLSLVVMTPGKQLGKVLDIKLPQFLVGRDPQCHLRPASPLISKRHCALIQRDGKAFIRDFASTNGTLVNDRPLDGEVELRDDDQLKIGPLLFAVRLKAAAVSRPTPAPPTKGAAQPTAVIPKQPAGNSVSSPTPFPPTSLAPPPSPSAETLASGDDEDAAAMLLSLQDDGGPTTPSGHHSPLPDIPEGSTIMEIPVPTDGTPQPAKGGTEQAKEKAKAASGNTSTAAKSILEKMMRRPRN